MAATGGKSSCIYLISVSHYDDHSRARLVGLARELDRLLGKALKILGPECLQTHMSWLPLAVVLEQAPEPCRQP